MNTMMPAIRLEMKLQRRYGFVYAALFSMLLWEPLVLLLPQSLSPAAMPYLVFGDLAIVGFFFIVGAVFFERGERTVFATLTTPMRFGDYLGAKLITLTGLAVLLSAVLVTSGVGFDFNVAAMLLAVVLCSLIFLLSGFVSAAPFRSVSDWMIPSTVVIGILNIPLLMYSGIWEHPIMYAFPTYGSLLMLGAALGQVTPQAWQWGYAVGYQLLWIVLLYFLAKRMFLRHIVEQEGSA